MTVALLPEPFRIHLPQFEGPFDLLLFFIERDELDIYDIPISRLTQEFLEYLQLLEQKEIEVASEFIFVAGTLMRIKAKMLLPRPELDEQGKEIDPREELVQRLLEYKRYKSVLEELMEMEEDQGSKVARGNIAIETKQIGKAETPIEELESLDVYTIWKMFKKIWEQHQYELSKPKHVIRQYPYKIEEVRDEIFQRALRQEKFSFIEFIQDFPDKIYFVFSFLAILELTQEKKIRLSVGTGFNQFWVLRREDAEVL